MSKTRRTSDANNTPVEWVTRKEALQQLRALGFTRAEAERHFEAMIAAEREMRVSPPD